MAGETDDDVADSAFIGAADNNNDDDGDAADDAMSTADDIVSAMAAFARCCDDNWRKSINAASNPASITLQM